MQKAHWKYMKCDVDKLQRMEVERSLEQEGSNDVQLVTHKSDGYKQVEAKTGI
jgi:hypothetical protein